MSYLSLARKYRPQTFKDLVGQELTARALSHAVSIQREPHAIMLTGVRGVGKTTLARIYAKALNCISGPTPEPCGTCENCVAIANGTHEDVLEIDGASHTSVDNIRSLIESVQFATQRSKFRVFMIDEVHMLSGSAFNALLKTIEEPPSHVIFIFATTELQKVPETILSRCQVFHLKKIPLDTIEARLENILRQEEIPYETSALKLIATEGQGSMRDALTLLDHVIALGGGGINAKDEVTRKNVEEIIPGASIEKLHDFLQTLVAKNAGGIFTCVDQYEQTGVDFGDLIENLCHHLRNSFVFKQLGENAFRKFQISTTDSEIKVYKDLATSAKTLELNRIFRFLVQCRKDLDGSEMDRYILENYCVEWCLDPGLPDWSESLSHTSQSSESAKTEKVLVSPLITPTTTIANKTIQPVAAAKSFPDSWENLVLQLRKFLPLQARKLEELMVECYSQEIIRLLVKKASFVSAVFVKNEEIVKLKGIFKEHFLFDGELHIKVLDDRAPAAPSILDRREQDLKELRDNLEKKLRESPAVKFMQENFNSRIEHIDIPDSAL